MSSLDTLFQHEILYETLRQSIDDIGLDDEDIDMVIRSLLPIAMEDESFISKFNYTLSPDSFKTRAQIGLQETIGTVSSSIIPKLPLPIYAFKRNTKPVVQLKSRLTSETIKFFNHHYGDELTLTYLQSVPHDHAAAAMSRKIEYDFLLKYCWDKYANPLLLPTNYDFSVIDVGGNWATAASRKQFGIHVCNPILDARDQTRDIRKRIMCNNTMCLDAYVCHSKFQDCTKTAPVAISVHSSYDISPDDIIRTMAQRGIANYVGSMFLPENIGSTEKYADSDYHYNMYIDKNTGLFEHTLTHLLSKVTAARAQNRTLVSFSFPEGQSREYFHDLNNLLKYKDSHTYHLNVSNSTTPLTFDYRIIKRVGSLIYFEFSQNFEKPRANLRTAQHIQSEPFDGYRVKLESSFIAPKTLKIGDPVDVYIPRGLFDTVANYCLTRISSEDFNVEQAITYTRSVMTTVQINESQLALHNNDDSFVTMVACGLASYQWATERYRLLESRVPYKKFVESYLSTDSSLMSLCNKIFNIDKVASDVKSAMSNIGSSVISSVLRDNDSVRARINEAASIISQSISPCLLELTDMSLVLPPINVVTQDRPKENFNVSSVYCTNLRLVVPSYPDYNQTVLSTSKSTSSTIGRYVEAKTLIDEIINKRFQANAHDFNTLQPSTYEIDPSEVQQINDSNTDNDALTIEIENMKAEERVQNITPAHDTHRMAILDFIRLAYDTDSEQLDNAKAITNKAINDDQMVPSLRPLQSDQKCSPFVISIVRGQVVAISTLEKKYHYGDGDFDETLSAYNSMKFCTKLRDERSEHRKFAILTLVGRNIYDGTILVDQVFDAVYVPEVQMMLSHMYKSLDIKIRRSVICQGEHTTTSLINGVAGCGKTHLQVTNYISCILNGQSPAIFSATNAAAQQAIDRIKASNIDITEGSISTVDSFLMHKNRWNARYTHVFIDEALQLHCGKLYALLEIINPLQLTGYGDERQITFINFSRFSEPTVNTAFPWSSKENIMTTRRIPDGPRIKWLQHPLLYGNSFVTAKPSADRITIYAETPSLDKSISIEWLYKQMRLAINAPLLVLVYRADVANDLRMRLRVTRKIPDPDAAHRLAVATIGESQGEDVPNSLLLRLSSKEEALYTKDDQTIVALTRSSESWGYITVPSNFPSLLEKIINESETRIKLSKI